MVIGHEMTHGFDDQGCNFDAKGNMVNWWTPEDAEKFQKLTQGLADQFNEIEIFPDLKANGAYTLGENIADHGGLRVAYTAWLDSQKKKGVDITSEEAKIDGLDPTQVFYMNYANLWPATRCSAPNPSASPSGNRTLHTHTYGGTASRCLFFYAIYVYFCSRLLLILRNEEFGLYLQWNRGCEINASSGFDSNQCFNVKPMKNSVGKS